VKRIVSAFALVLAASLAAGCGSSTSPASVNGKAVDGAKFLERLGQYSEFNGGNDRSASILDSSDLLTQHIVAALRADDVRRLGLTVSDEDVASMREQVVGALEASVEAGDAESGIINDSFIDYVARAEAERTVLLARITDTQNPWFTADDVRQYYDFVKEARYRNYCTHHILVAAEADATAIIGQLENGADFTQIARERSTDTESAAQGGDLGCVMRGEFVPEFENAVLNASAGDTIGPVQTSSGFHVIRVDREYGLQELDDDLRAEIAAVLNTEEGWLVWKVHSSSIDVNKRYGTWSNDAQSVVPRSDPTVR
jgi:peptidyl-prolyl cis-trans isomerase C